MSIAFKRTIDLIIEREKGYTNLPADRGGPTNYGITQAVARENGWMGSMKDLPRTIAEMIYLKRYITEPSFDKVYAINAPIGQEMIDTGVNMGVSIPGPMLQRWLNVFNARGTKYSDVFVDGRIGPVTLDALGKFLDYRGKDGESVLLGALNSLQAVRYLEIAEHNPSQEDFVYGQVLQRVVRPAT